MVIGIQKIGTKKALDFFKTVGISGLDDEKDYNLQLSLGGLTRGTSPLEMAAAYGAIANDGVRVTPHVIKYSPEEEAIKVRRTQVMTPEHARAVTDLLTESINRGKSPIKSNIYNIAAKTGTSIKPKENGAGYTNKLYTSIVGYMPSSDPQVLIYVIVDSAQGGEIWGNTVAAPIFKEISTCA